MSKEKLQTKTIRQYWFGRDGILRRVFTGASDGSGMSGNLVTFFISLSLVFVAGIGVAFGIIPISIFGEQINNFLAGLSASCFSGVIFLFWFLVMLYRAPAEVDDEQKKELAGYRSKELKLFVDSGRDITVDVGGGIPKVTLTINVINRELRKIIDLEAYLVSVDQVTEELPDDWSFTNRITSFRSQRLEWKDKKYIIDLSPGFPETFVKIVSLDCSTSEVMFIHEGQTRRIPDLQRDSLYRIQIEFKGKLEGENPDYRFFHYYTMFVCAPHNSQIGYLSNEQENQNIPNWLRRKINLEIDKTPKELEQQQRAA